MKITILLQWIIIITLQFQMYFIRKQSDLNYEIVKQHNKIIPEFVNTQSQLNKQFIKFIELVTEDVK